MSFIDEMLKQLSEEKKRLNIINKHDERAINESIYSYLPGRENGPADAYRHIWQLRC